MEKTIHTLIKEYVRTYPAIKKTQTKWEEPLIAFADADDQMFMKLKEIISPSHELPSDFLNDAQTVITYFVPFEKSAVMSNIQGRECSKTWGVAYIETNRLIYDLNVYIKEELSRLRYDSTIIPATHNFDEEKLISAWSHRHVAYIAGLGTFGLNNMLITEKGCCGRVGSIVTNLKIEPTKKVKTESCLYKSKGTCKKCVVRCVNDALKVDSFNRNKCYDMCLYNNELLTEIGLVDVCGKCLVDVPCSFTNPSKGL